MALSVGTVLGAYEIVALIGAGGMGEVYRARDTRLRREVAVKVLPEGVAANPHPLRRFQQEALAAAALNHPNILAVYDTGVAGGVPFVVTELLDGQTVAERLLQGPLPLPKALDYAVQIATGLIAAHDHGIVHRDLKPDNVFITRDERVKILDFGVAKLTEPGPALEGRTTITGTNPGTLLGTVGYMSPEQVRGEVIDHRSDLFSFGVLFYEMLTAERAFRRDTPIDTLSAILHDELHDVSVADPSLPAALGRVVRHCLQKKPSERFQSARDLCFALESFTGEPTATYDGTRRVVRGTTRRERLAWMAALLAAVVSTAIVVWALRPAREPTVPGANRLVRFSVSPPATTVYATTDSAGETPQLALSPDGRYIVVGKPTNVHV